MQRSWQHVSSYHIPRTVLVTSSLALALFCLPGAGPPEPDASPAPFDTARAIGSRHGWVVSLAESCTDTLAARASDVVGAAERCLEADDWSVETRDRARGDLVTAWKELHHPMARILMGRVDARCAVAVRPIDDGRTLVVFQGALASKDPLDGNPALRLAMKAYRNAAHDWQQEVRGDLMAHGVLAGPGR